MAGTAAQALLHKVDDLPEHFWVTDGQRIDANHRGHWADSDKAILQAWMSLQDETPEAPPGQIAVYDLPDDDNRAAHRRIRRRLHEGYEEAKARLQAHWPLVQTVAEELIRHYPAPMRGDELRRLLKKGA